MVRERLRRCGVAAAVLAGVILPSAAGLVSGTAGADPGRLPPFTPGPSDWSPHTDIWPYTTFTYQLTPEMIGGMSESCQWFAARFDPLMGQITDFNRVLGDQHDVYAGVAPQADAVLADLDTATAFLAPRVTPLTIRNNPDNFGPYSPIYGGEQMTGILFQLSRIADGIRRKEPSGITHAHVLAAAGWGNALRDSGACT